MIECYCCGKKVASESEAVENGWIPSFVKHGDAYESSEPVCAECVHQYLSFNPDFEDFEERKDGTA